LTILFGTSAYVEKAALPFMLDPVGSLARIQGAEIDRIIVVPPSAGDGPPQDTGDVPPIDPDPQNDPKELPRNQETAFRLEATLEPHSTIAIESGIGAGNLDLQGHKNVRRLKQGGRLFIRGMWEFVPYNDAHLPKPTDQAFVLHAKARRDALMAASNEAQRKDALKALKQHFEATYKTPHERNVISLFLYAGADPRVKDIGCGCKVASDRFTLASARHAWGPGLCAFPHAHASILYTGDGYLNTEGRWNCLARYLGSARVSDLLALQVMHHGARSNSRPGLAADIRPHFSVFSSDPGHRRFHHPDDEVVKDFEAVSRIAFADRYNWVNFTLCW
jgi:hypothetical protein